MREIERKYTMESSDKPLGSFVFTRVLKLYKQPTFIITEISIIIKFIKQITKIYKWNRLSKKLESNENIICKTERNITGYY